MRTSSVGLSVHQRAVLRHGRADVAASLRGDTLGQRKGLAPQLTRVGIERLAPSSVSSCAKITVTGGVRHRRLGLKQRDRAPGSSSEPILITDGVAAGQQGPVTAV